MPSPIGADPKMKLVQDIEAELRTRIGADLTHFNGRLPERNAIAWRAYLAGLLEWSVIDVPVFDRLTAILPDVVDDPSVQIMLGRE
jgi:hypothetical protein